MAVNLRSINPDGTATLADGTEVQLVMAPNGSIGARPVTNQDHVAKLDQVGPPPGFDISGLDQTGPPPPLPTH